MKVRGVRMYGAYDIRTEEFTLPEIKEDEILLKIICDSICMSTWKEIKQGSAHIRVPDTIAEKPVIIGHEFSGVIEKVGAKWKEEFREGEHYAVQPGIPGQHEAPGYSYEYFGGGATYCIVPNDMIEKGSLHHYKGEAYFEASVAEPMLCIIGGYHANYHTSLDSYEHTIGAKAGGNLLILGGCGPMGMGAVSYALAMENRPAMIVVTEVNEDRLQRARRLIPEKEAEEKGIALHYVNTANMEDQVRELLDMTDGKGFDDVFIYAPVKQIAEVGDQVLAEDGCLNLFAGPTDKNFSAMINLYDCHYRNTKVVGASGGKSSDLEEALELISEKKVKPEVMITHIGGMDAYADTTLKLPEIPGGKKLIYTQFDLPLTAIDDFGELGKENPLFAELASVCEKHKGLWNKEAEDILLAHFHVI